MKKSLYVLTSFLAAGFSSSLAQPLIESSEQFNISSGSIENNDLIQNIHISRPAGITNPANCNIFDNPRSVACTGSSDNVYQPQDRFDRYVIKGATYATKFVPLLNSNAERSEYSNMILNDGKNYIVDAGNSFANSTVNGEIQKIPFFAQTSVSIHAHSDGETSFSVDSLMKLKELDTDGVGDLKTLLFSQGRYSIATNSDGSTMNLGLGLRHRPNDESMLGSNVFWDYRMTDYDDAHSRFGLGGEYFWNDFELRNNWYMAITDTKNITIDGTDYIERVVPGWDAEIGYRFPNMPQLGVFAKVFNWDYKDTNDNSGVEGSVNWQATPHLNFEAYASNEISGVKTVHNSSLPGTDEVFLGLRFNWTARPMKIRKTTTKERIVNQMTQPVRRRYDVLLERSTGAFKNRAKGS